MCDSKAITLKMHYIRWCCQCTVNHTINKLCAMKKLNEYELCVCVCCWHHLKCCVNVCVVGNKSLICNIYISKIFQRKCIIHDNMRLYTSLSRQHITQFIRVFCCTVTARVPPLSMLPLISRPFNSP